MEIAPAQSGRAIRRDAVTERISSLSILRCQNARLLYGGYGLSLIGTWMTRVAVGWLVFRMTNSAWMLGLVAFTGQIPSFLLGPIAGALVDRWSARRILILTQFLSMIQAFMLAGLALFHIIEIWHIVCLSLLRGVINAFDTPAREAFLLKIAEPDAAAGTTSINSAMVNAARLIGPSIAGLIIATAGEGYCFLVDGLSYLAAIYPVCRIKTGSAERRSQSNVFRDVAEGWNYVSNCSTFRSVLLLLMLMSLVGMPFTVLLPLFAGTILNGGPYALGMLLSASGCGALAGALCLARNRDSSSLWKTIPFAAISFGAGLIMFSQARLLWQAVGLIFLASFSMMQYLGRSSLLLKATAEENKRGRVISYYTMAFMGMPPVGCLLAGSFAGRFGSSSTLLCSGAICLAGGILFALRPKLIGPGPAVVDGVMAR
jgi:MFS family permease